MSPSFTDVAEPGDVLEVRGPIGGYFVWDADCGGPLALVAGGSGLVPLMCIERHWPATAPEIESHLLLSVRTRTDALYADEPDGARIMLREGGRRVDAALLADAFPPPERRPAATCAARRASWRWSPRSSSPSATTAPLSRPSASTGR